LRQFWCLKHNQIGIGSTCGEDYCLECSKEYQQYIKTAPKAPTPMEHYMSLDEHNNFEMRFDVVGATRINPIYGPYIDIFGKYH
jgi:hypothetical protein